MEVKEKISGGRVRPFRIIEKKGGELTVDIAFHEGQARAWGSEAQWVAILCGSQWGKSEFGSTWLKREIENRGPGDYLIGTSTYKLLTNKLEPDFVYMFEDVYRLGTYSSGKQIFNVSKEGEVRLWGEEQDVPTRVLVFSGQSPGGAEAATAKAAWLDEVGQEDFKEDTFEAVERRLRINQGRILFTTTLYNFGWLKRRVYDPWIKGDKSIDIIQSDSIVNPKFPLEEWEKAKASLPPWKFDLFYRGRFTRPAGMVYDCFDSSAHCIKRFDIPITWPRYTGHDFGPANMVCIWIAQNPGTGDFFLYRAYHRQGTKSVGQDVSEWDRMMDVGEKKLIVKSVGGAPRIEDGWRDAFRAHGWPILPPKIEKPDNQIMRVYDHIKSNKFFIFDDLPEVVDDIVALSYKLDDQQQPTDKIDNDAKCHYAAALRYIGSDFNPETAVASGPRILPSVFKRKRKEPSIFDLIRGKS